jgi:hypothetical protein
VQEDLCTTVNVSKSVLKSTRICDELELSAMRRVCHSVCTWGNAVERRQSQLVFEKKERKVRKLLHLKKIVSLNFSAGQESMASYFPDPISL